MRARRRFFLIVVAVGLILFFSFPILLRSAGDFLVDSSPPEKADAVILLAGDFSGSRLMRAVELVRSGYAPLILVSGPAEAYGINEATLAIQFAARQGIPSTYFEPVFMEAHSTVEEAQALAPELKRRDIRNVIIVTSNYHTRRARGVFERVLGPGIRVQAVSAPDRYFHPDWWWQNREGQKTLFLEYSKTVAGWLGM